MQDATFHALPSPLYNMFGSKLDPGDVIQTGDRASTLTNGWVPVDPALLGFQVGESDPTTYVRPAQRLTTDPA